MVEVLACHGVLWIEGQRAKILFLRAVWQRKLTVSVSKCGENVRGLAARERGLQAPNAALMIAMIAALETELIMELT